MASLLLALHFPDLGTAVGLLGSVLGGALIYAVPAAMHAALPSNRRRVGVLAIDAFLIFYGVVGQCLAGTVITWRHSRRGKATKVLNK